MGSGTLRFSQSEPNRMGVFGMSSWDGMPLGNVPAFMDIEDVASVYRLVSGLREKAAQAALRPRIETER